MMWFLFYRIYVWTVSLYLKNSIYSLFLFTFGPAGHSRICNAKRCSRPALERMTTDYSRQLFALCLFFVQLRWLTQRDILVYPSRGTLSADVCKCKLRTPALLVARVKLLAAPSSLLLRDQQKSPMKRIIASGSSSYERKTVSEH